MVGVGAERTDDSRLQSVVSGQLSATCIALSWMSSSQIQQNWRLRAGTGVTDRRCRRLWTRTRAVRFLLAQSFCNGSTGSGATLPPRTLFRFDELATFFILVNLNIPTQQLQIVCPVGVCQCWYNIVNNVCAKCSIALPCMTATPAPSCRRPCLLFPSVVGEMMKLAAAVLVAALHLGQAGPSWPCSIFVLKYNANTRGASNASRAANRVF